MNLLERLRHGALRLGGGHVASQTILFLAIPVLARIYDQDQFGKYGTLVSIAAVLAAVMLLRYETYIPAASASACNHRLPAALVVVLTTVIVIAWLPLTIALTQLPFGERPPDLTEAGMLATLSLVAAGAYASFNALAILASRLTKYSIVNRARVYRSALTVILQVTLAPTNLIHPLFAGDVASRCVSLIGMIKSLRIRLRFSLRYLKWLLVRNWKYPLLSAPAALMNAASTNMMVPIVGVLFGPGRAGEVFLLSRLAAVPVSLLGQTIAIAYAGAVSNYIQSRRYADIRSAVVKSSALLAVVAAPCMILAYLLLKHWGTTLLGENWTGLHSTFGILAPVFVAQLAFSSFSQSLNIFGLQGFQLGWDTCRLLLVGIALTYPVMLNLTVERQFSITMISYASVMTIMYVIQYGYFVLQLGAMERANSVIPGTPD